MAMIFWVLLVLGGGGALAYGAWDAGFPFPGIAAGAVAGGVSGQLIYSGLKAFFRKPEPGADNHVGGDLSWYETDEKGDPDRAGRGE